MEGSGLSHPTGHCPPGDPPCHHLTPPRPTHVGSVSPAPCYGTVEALRWGTSALLEAVTEGRGKKGLSRDIAMRPMSLSWGVGFHPRGPGTCGSASVLKAAGSGGGCWVWGDPLSWWERGYLDTRCWCCRAHRSPAPLPLSACSSPSLREEGAGCSQGTPQQTSPWGHPVQLMAFGPRVELGTRGFGMVRTHSQGWASIRGAASRGSHLCPRREEPQTRAL